MSMTLRKPDAAAAVKGLVLLAVLLIGALLLRWQAGERGALRTQEDRVAYLAALGWEAEAASETCQEIRIPDCGEGMMADYDRMQRELGYPFGEHSGEKCSLYSYRVLNYPGYDREVLAMLYVQNGRVIGGDLHTAAVNGFMHGLRPRAGT